MPAVEPEGYYGHHIVLPPNKQQRKALLKIAPPSPSEYRLRIMFSIPHCSRLFAVILALIGATATAQDHRTAPVLSAQPLAQDYQVLFKAPQSHIYTGAASLVHLPGGRLLSSNGLFTRVGREAGHPDREIETVFRVSRDHGASWEPRGSVPLGDGLPFVHGGKLYFLCNGPGRQNIVLVQSDDEGATWSEPVVLFEGRFWNTFASHVVDNNTLYWSLGTSNAEGDFNRRGSGVVVVAGDLSAADLMSPAAWRMSAPLRYPGTPAGLTSGLYPPSQPNWGDHWLEPNVLRVDGKLRVLVRLRLDGMATAHMCAVCSLEDDGGRLDLQFTQFHPMPGAHCYFCILRDEVTGYYWTVVNMPTNSQDIAWGKKLNREGFLGTAGNERRILMLLYSADALNWFQAGCVALWPSPLQGFQYAVPLIDGDDMLITSRTSKERKNQHDNDLITLHRVADFRKYALNLWPGERAE